MDWRARKHKEFRAGHGSPCTRRRDEVLLTMWDIPAATTGLPKNAHDIGKVGKSFRGQLGYEPPNSQGSGLKNYTIHLYALSESPRLAQNPSEVTREVLLSAIKDSILDSADLKVTYKRPEPVHLKDSQRRAVN